MGMETMGDGIRDSDTRNGDGDGKPMDMASCSNYWRL